MNFRPSVLDRIEISYKHRSSDLTDSLSSLQDALYIMRLPMR